MSYDIYRFWCIYLQRIHFFIQMDETSPSYNQALLSGYIRFLMNQKIDEELHFAKTKDDTKYESVCKFIGRKRKCFLFERYHRFVLL